MAAPSAANSQTFAYAAAATESHFSSTEYYDTIVVTNGTAVALAVAVDGGTAVAGATTHNLEVPANSTVEFDNEQTAGLPNWNTKPNQDWSQTLGTTAQQGFTGTAPTYCSVIPEASATGDVTITFQ